MMRCFVVGFAVLLGACAQAQSITGDWLGTRFCTTHTLLSW